MKSPNHLSHPSTGLLTFSIVAGSSILFCSKGVFAKLAFAEGADALTVLALRMGFSLPFFVAMIFFASRSAVPLKISEWVRLAGLGFLGYYLSSLVNFTGLQYVSIGLKRIILYTYPSLVLVFSAIVLRKWVRPAVWIACTVAWIGIVAAFSGEMSHPAATGQTLFGGSLIFASALTYAAFLMISGDTIHRVGAIRFTGIAVGFSCLFMLLHYAIAHPLTGLARLSPTVYGYGILLAIFGTVLPSLLMSEGLKRAGAQKFAIISAIGPVATLFLAWAMLDEKPNLFQFGGFVLTVSGGLAISLLKDKPEAEAVDRGRGFKPDPTDRSVARD